MGPVTEMPVPEDCPDQGSVNYDKQVKSSLGLSMAQELRMVSTFLKCGKTKKKRNNDKEEYATETTCGRQNLKYLLSGPLPKKRVNPPGQDPTNL